MSKHATEQAEHGPEVPSETRYGVPIRPPHMALFDTQFACDRIAHVDENGLPSGASRPVVVRQGAFIGVVADHLEDAQRAAAQLEIDWASAVSPQAYPLAETDSQTWMPDAGHGAVSEYCWPNRLHGGPREAFVVAEHTQAGLRVWADTPTPDALRTDLALLCSLPPQAVEIFSRAPRGLLRTGIDDVAGDAALFARAVQAPVAVKCSPEVADSWAALGMAQRIELAVDRSCGEAVTLYGRWRHRGNGAPVLALLLAGQDEDTVAEPAGDRAVTADISSPYRFADERWSGPSPAVDRRWGGAISTRVPRVFARESFIDELAHRNGRDPLQWRLDRLRDDRGRALLAAAARRAGEFSRSTDTRHDAVFHGRGVAFDRDDRAGQAACSAWIVDLDIDRVTGDVSLTRLVVGEDSGRDIDQEALKLEIERQFLTREGGLLDGPDSPDEWGDQDGKRQRPEVDSVTLAPIEGDSPRLSALAPVAGVSLAPGVAAVANALFDATGIRFRQPPFDAPRLRRAMAARGLIELDQPARTPTAGWRRWLGATAVAAIVGGLGALAVAWPFKSSIATQTPPPKNFYSQTTIARGRLVAEAGDCAACHTAEGGATNAGGHVFDTPFGTIYSTNITPDVATGIGAWSYPAFERAMRRGIARDGRHLYPVFPYDHFAKLSSTDMQALYAYLMVQPAVSQSPPKNDLKAPFGFRALLAGWNALYLDTKPFTPDPMRNARYNRGAYLAEGIGHCSACHSPRNVLGAEKSGAHHFAGGEAQGWEAPPLNELSKAPVPWTEEALYEYLRTGYAKHHGPAAGPMGPVVAGLARLPKDDVKAIAHYIATFEQTASAPALERDEQARKRIAQGYAVPAGLEQGERLFQGSCASCHTDTGVSAFNDARTELALNSNLSSRSPDNVIQVILHGIQGHAEVGDMPGFADSLNDAQIATLTRYLRARFAPDQPAWSNVDARTRAIRRKAP